MELKLKYQYTYFIKPFIIRKDKYETYIGNLIKNKKCKLKIFEKEREFNLYSYFLQNVREYFFPTFSFDKDKINELEQMNDKVKATTLSKLHCNIFEYNVEKNIQGKVSDENGIFFNIEKIEIICFDTGICFLNIKTNIENSNKFSDLLNFNYKFKDINSDFNKLKEYNNIKIQTDKFSNMTEISDFIDEIIGVNSDAKELKTIDLYNKRCFVYTYACVEQSEWKSEEDFKNIENDFIKYSNVVSNNSSLDFNMHEMNKTMKTIETFKYAKFGFTKQSSSLMTSSIDINNYTKLLFEYENDYLYTLLISLYQRIYLKRMKNIIKETKDINKIKDELSKFTKEIWLNEITNSVTGTMFYNEWKKTFELEEIYSKIKNEYDVIYKELNIENARKINKVIIVALGISLALNIINFITLIRNL